MLSIGRSSSVVPSDRVKATSTVSFHMGEARNVSVYPLGSFLLSARALTMSPPSHFGLSTFSCMGSVVQSAPSPKLATSSRPRPSSIPSPLLGSKLGLLLSSHANRSSVPTRLHPGRFRRIEGSGVTVFSHGLPLIDPCTFLVTPTLASCRILNTTLCRECMWERRRRPNRGGMSCGRVVRSLTSVRDGRSAVVTEWGSTEHGSNRNALCTLKIRNY